MRVLKIRPIGLAKQELTMSKIAEECSDFSGTPMTLFPNPREYFRVWNERTVGTRGLGRSVVFCIWFR